MEKNECGSTPVSDVRGQNSSWSRARAKNEVVERMHGRGDSLLCQDGEREWKKKRTRKRISIRKQLPWFYGRLGRSKIDFSSCPPREVDMVTRYRASVSLSASSCPSTIELSTFPLLPINPAAKPLPLPSRCALLSNTVSRPGTIQRVRCLSTWFPQRGIQSWRT